MTSRPRASLLALFDPLTISETSQAKPTRDSCSPAPSSESGSDKENVNSTTPKGSLNSGACNSQADLLGSSFSSICLEPTGEDSSNLCLVQLADELDSACKITDADDIILQRSQGPREPLSEICLVPSNGSNRTPQSVARDKHLINLDSPSNSTTPKSLRKFAAGISKYEPSAPCTSPLASHGPPRTPQNLDPTNVKTSKQASPHTGADKLASIAPSIPFISNSPSLLSSTPAPDPHPVFHDPPSSHFGSSFEINDPSCMKKMNLTGDLLKDDLSFLKQLGDDSFTDIGRGDNIGASTDRTANSSPKTPQEIGNNALSVRKSGSLHGTSCAMQDEGRRNTKAETPARKPSTVFRRSSSVSGLVFGSKREEFSIALSSPIRLEPRTPSSSPRSNNHTRGQALAPRKTQTVIRRNGTLSRSVNIRIASPVKEESDDEHEGTRNAKKGSLRPRPSSMEVRPVTRTQSFLVKQVDKTTTPNSVFSTVGRRESVSRPALGRRASVGRGLSPTRPRASDFKQDQTQKPSQGHSSQNNRPVSVLRRRVSVGRTLSPVRPKAPDFKPDQTQKPSTTSFAASNRRLSVSTASKPTPVKTNNFATTGRLGGARRVPLTANAPLFKANDLTNKAVQSPKPTPRIRTESKTSPQRRSALSSTSRTLGRSTSGPNVSSSLEKTSTPSVATTKTLGRAASASSAVFSRSSFMTTSSSSVTSSSRLPTLPAKSSNRLAGLGARKAFK